VLTKVEVLEPTILSLELGGANQSPIQIRDISGLEPVKAEITFVPSNQDIDLFQNARLGKRNIVFKLGLDPNWIDQTMSSLRRLLYAHFPPKEWRSLRFYSDDMPMVEIGGYVESVEPNMFSQDPEMQISIICPRPNFADPSTGIPYTGL
jgi:hypothetical protein